MKKLQTQQAYVFRFPKGLLVHAAVSSSSEAKDLGGEKSICLHSLFLLTVEAQKKWVVEGADPYRKKKDAVFVELRAPHRAKGAF